MPGRSQLASSFGLALVAALATAKVEAEHVAQEPPARARIAGAARPPEAQAQGAAPRAALARTEPPAARRRKRVHFDNGPRAVPRPRGASLARARALGIGDHASTRQLLWSRPSAELLRAVPGERPRSLLWPVVGGRWGRGFGYTRRVRKELRHNGIDIGAPEGTPVRAAAAGLVVYSDNTLENLGNAVLILHPGGWTTLYAHNLRNTVQPGWYVERGERIALIGQTGAAWGPHLHFELRDNGRWRDPKPFLTGYKDESLEGPLVELPSGTAARDEAGTPERRVDAGSPDAAEPAALANEPALPFEVGTLQAARRALDGAIEARDAAQLGRRFSNLLWPLKGGEMGRPFGPEHRAIDARAAAGTPVRVAADGVVVYSGPGLPGYGYAVVVLHRESWVTVYGRLAEATAVPSGTRVLRGQWIGRVGEAEPESSPHLHFEWRVAGQLRDPSDHFVGR